MAFPDTWLQAWLWLEFAAPGMYIPPNRYFTASCFWFRLAAGTFPTTGPDIDALVSNTADQLWFACLFSPIQLFNSKVTVFGSSPGGGFAGFKQYTLGVNDWTGYLPSSIGLTYARKTGTFSNSVHGRFYMPHVLEGAVDGNFVDPGALGLYQIGADEFNTDVFGNACLFRPILASYRDSAAYDIDHIVISQRSALTRKRSRPRVFKAPFVSGPKNPPA